MYICPSAESCNVDNCKHRIPHEKMKACEAPCAIKIDVEKCKQIHKRKDKKNESE